MGIVEWLEQWLLYLRAAGSIPSKGHLSILQVPSPALPLGAQEATNRFVCLTWIPFCLSVCLSLLSLLSSLPKNKWKKISTGKD